MEYINGTWYRISWTIDQCYEVSREDEIEDPQESGLGTKSQPFLLAPDLERIHTEVTQGSDEAPEVETTSPVSDPDIPTTDQAHAPVIEQLTEAMAAIAVAHVQPAQVAGPAQAPQPQLEDNQQEEDNPNNHQPEDNHLPEDNQAAEEAVEAVEEAAAEANQQLDKQQPDKQQPHHPAAKPSKE